MSEEQDIRVLEDRIQMLRGLRNQVYALSLKRKRSLRKLKLVQQAHTIGEEIAICKATIKQLKGEL